MHEFLNALNEFREADRCRWSDRLDDREAGSVMDVVISATRSKIGSAFSTDRKIPAKRKVEASV